MKNSARLLFLAVLTSLLSFTTGVFAIDAIHTQRDIVTMHGISSIDQMQQDTIRYDDTSPLNSRFTTPNQWAAIRFTPISTYEVRSVYLEFNNSQNRPDTITILAVADSVNGTQHLPKMSSILGQISGVMIPNPVPPATAVWVDTSFSVPFTRNQNQDFWIVYGVCPAGLTSGNGSWPLFDNSVDNLGRSLYVTGTSRPTNSSSWLAIFGYDWRCRVGGQYTNLHYIDLQSQYLYATSKKFQLATGFAAQTFKAVIRNVGTDTVHSYSVIFTGRNGINQVIWTSTVSRSQLIPGATDTVQAGSTFGGMSADVYTIKDSVTVSGEAVTTNNISTLEQYVYDPAQPYEYRYDNSQININFSPSINAGVMVRFKPDNYPCEMDSVILMYSGTTPFVANLYVYTDSVGITGPHTLLYSRLNIRGAVVSNNRFVISVPALTILSGSYYIGFISDSNFVVGLNNDNPLACQNIIMGTQRYAGVLNGGALTWSNDVGSELTIRASIKRTPSLAVSLTPTGTSTGYVGTTVWYPMIVSNTGQSSDSYNLSVTNAHWPTQIFNSAQTQLISQIGPIPSGTSQQIEVKVAIPAGVNNGAIDTAIVHATSRTNGSITSQASNFTHAIHLIDLESQYLFSTSKKFHLAGGFAGQVYKAVIHNTGNDTVSSYTVYFTGNNKSGAVVWTSFTMHGSIAPNGTDTIQASTTFSGVPIDVYTIQDSVSAVGDVNITNNMSYLEQYVFDSSQPYEFHYDDGTTSVNQNLAVNSGLMVRYQPDSYPAALDNIIFNYNGAAPFVSNLYVYGDSIGISGPRTLLYSHNQYRGTGSRVAIHIPSVIISSGSYYVGLLCDSNLSVGINNELPFACQNLLMGTQRYSGSLVGSTLTWTSEIGQDPVIRATIRNADLAVAVSPSGSGNGFVGTDVWYAMTISNFGESTDNYNVSISGNLWPTQIWNDAQNQQISTTGPIASSFTLPIKVKVSIPLNAANGLQDTANIHVVSQYSPTIFSQATVITKAVHNIDLQSQVLYATSKKFQIAAGSSNQLFRTIIRNSGNDTVISYSVHFTGRDSANAIVWTSTVTSGPIAPGGVDTVQADSPFAAMVAGTYTIMDSISATGDVTASNDCSYLEQYVYNPMIPNEFQYDDGVVISNTSYPTNTGIMVRYKPDSYPAVMDSIILINGCATEFTTNLYVYTDSIGVSAPVNLIYTQNGILCESGRTSLGIPALPIYSGSFYIGFICDTNLNVGMNSDSPVACENSAMGTQRFSGVLTGATVSWTAEVGNEPMIHARIRQPNLSVSIGPSATQTGFPETDIWYPMAVLNIGEVYDSYHLTVSGNNWVTQIWNGNMSQQIGSTILLAPYTSQTINIKVSVPQNATIGYHDTTQVQAVSNLNPTTSSSSTTVSSAFGFVANSGGPDGWGYQFITDRAENGPGWSWEDTSGATRLPDQIGNDDDYNWQIVLPAGFNFKFYGQMVDTFWVSSNGFLLFNRTIPESTYPENPISMETAPNAYLSIMHTDLIYGDGASNIWGGVYCKTIGIEPTRQFIISWIGMKQWNLQSGSSISFQTVLYENSNNIESRYQNGLFGDPLYDYGVSATIGLKSWTGIDTLAYSVVSNSAAAIGSQTVIDFLYPVLVSQNNLTASVSGNDITLNWSPIGEGVTNYSVWADSIQPYSSENAWYYLGSSTSTSFVDVNRIITSPFIFYRITAIDNTDAIRHHSPQVGLKTLTNRTDRIRIVRGFGNPKPQRPRL